MSSFNIPGKFFPLAYHFDDQFFSTASLKPVGFIFCPIMSGMSLFFVAGFVANSKKNMTGWLDDAIATAFGARTGTHH